MADRPRVFAEFDGAVTFRRHVIRIDHRDRSLDQTERRGQGWEKVSGTGKSGEQRSSASGRVVNAHNVASRGPRHNLPATLGLGHKPEYLYVALRAEVWRAPSTHPPATTYHRYRMKRRLEWADRPFDQAQRIKELTTDGHRLRRSPSGRR
jgi:hypothetical protein